MQAGSPNTNGFAGAGAGKKKHPPLDWEVVFEHPETGLITYVSMAKSSKSLQKCSQVIVQTLFNRDGDEERRIAFGAIVNDILAYSSKGNNSEAVALVKAKTKITQVLRNIKVDRLERAKLAKNSLPPGSLRTKEPEIIEKTSGDAKTNDDGNEAAWRLNTDETASQDSQISSVEEEPESEKLIGGYHKGTPESFFIQTLATAMMDRLAVLRGKSINRRKFPEGIPFILSSEFADHFRLIITEKVLPRLVDGCFVMINRMSVLPKEQWKEFLQKSLEDRTDRVILWERWNIAWLDAMTQRELPEKPAASSAKAKKGIMAFFAKLAEDDHYDDDDDGEMTIEEWKEAVVLIRKENSEAKECWTSLSAQSADYISPLNEDGTLLMELFGHSVDAYLNDIKVLQKIIRRKEGRSREFESHQRGKNLDLPLLSVCYRYPEIMLEGDETALSTMVAGFDRRWREETLQLSTRYLSEKMKRAVVDDL